jgi:hypothetical protein
MQFLNRTRRDLLAGGAAVMPGVLQGEGAGGADFGGAAGRAWQRFDHRALERNRDRSVETAADDGKSRAIARPVFKWKLNGTSRLALHLSSQQKARRLPKVTWDEIGRGPSLRDLPPGIHREPIGNRF